MTRREDPFAALADNLTYYRHKRKMSPYDLERAVGVEPRVIEEIEAERRKVGLPMLARIASALQVSTYELI